MCCMLSNVIWCVMLTYQWKLNPSSHDHWCWHNISIHHSSNTTSKKSVSNHEKKNVDVYYGLSLSLEGWWVHFFILKLGYKYGMICCQKTNAWKTQMTNYGGACTLVLIPWNWTKKRCFWMWFAFSMNTKLNMARKAWII